MLLRNMSLERTQGKTCSVHRSYCIRDVAEERFYVWTVFFETCISYVTEILLEWFGAFAWHYHMRKGMFTYLRSSPHHKYGYYLFKSRGVPFSSNGKLRGEFKMLKIIPSVLWILDSAPSFRREFKTVRFQSDSWGFKFFNGRL